MALELTPDQAARLKKHLKISKNITAGQIRHHRKLREIRKCKEAME